MTLRSPVRQRLLNTEVLKTTNSKLRVAQLFLAGRYTVSNEIRQTKGKVTFFRGLGNLAWVSSF